MLYLTFLSFLGVFLSTPFVLLVILVFVRYFPIKTICFTCHSCDFGLGGTPGYALFLKNSLETFAESLQGTVNEDTGPLLQKLLQQPLAETTIEARIAAPTEAPADAPVEALTEALRGLLRRFTESLSKGFSE